MMKNLILIFLAFLLLGCPVYDPPTGALLIKNATQDTVYVHLTCDATLPLDPELKAYLSMGNDVYDNQGNAVIDTIHYPNYRIEPDSIGVFRVWGTVNQPELPCDIPSMNLFFITESVMRKYTWADIVNGQMYYAKLTVTKSQLDSSNWQLRYGP